MGINPRQDRLEKITGGTLGELLSKLGGRAVVRPALAPTGMDHSPTSFYILFEVKIGLLISNWSLRRYSLYSSMC